MRTITTKVYEFSELQEAAKERARAWYRTSSIPLAWQEENAASVEAIANAMNCTVEYRSYDGISYDVTLTSNDEIEEISGIRAWKYCWNNFIEPNLQGKTIAGAVYNGKLHYNAVGGDRTVLYHSKATLEFSCPFTGYYMDDALIIAWNKHRKDFAGGYTVAEFINDVAAELSKEWTDDNENQISDESVDEMLAVNGYEFTEDGAAV